MIKLRGLILLLAIFGGLHVVTSASTSTTNFQSHAEPENVEVHFSNVKSFTSTAISAILRLYLSNTINREESFAHQNLHHNLSRGLGQIDAAAIIANYELDINYEGVGLQNKRSGRCLDVPGAVTYQFGTEIYDCSLSDNQKLILKFTEESIDDGSRTAPTFTIVMKHSNKCLDVTGGSSDNNVGVEQYDCEKGAKNQEWYLRWINLPTATATATENPFSNPSDAFKHIFEEMMKDHSFGYFQLVGVKSGKCLTVNAGDTENNIPLNIYTCGDGADNQLWKFL